MREFDTQGFEIIRGVFSAKEVEGLRKEADRVAGIEGSACVRHLREKSKEFSRLATSVRLKRLLPKGQRPVRSILFDKTLDANWPVAWHQDLTITVDRKVDVANYGPWSTKDGSIHVQPPEALLSEMVTIRIHLDDTPVTNGALRVIPKSQQNGKIPGNRIRSHIDDSEVICACEAGDVLLMSPLILHSSRRAEIPQRRRVVHFEYAYPDSLNSKLNWYEPLTLK